MGTEVRLCLSAPALLGVEGWRALARMLCFAMGEVSVTLALRESPLSCAFRRGGGCSSCRGLTVSRTLGWKPVLFVLGLDAMWPASRRLSESNFFNIILKSCFPFVCFILKILCVQGKFKGELPDVAAQFNNGAHSDRRKAPA